MIREMEENTTIVKLSTETYSTICNSVLDYINSFTSENDQIQNNFDLKKEHIHRVIGYTEVLARNLELDQEIVLAAQLAALLHDVGRFKQFQEYQTFSDYESVDHAKLGHEIILENEWLLPISDDIKSDILLAVQLHNKIEVPKNISSQAKLITKIIRDADKIDILDMAVREYALQNDSRNPSFTLDLEDSFQISKQIAKSLLSEKLPDRKHMKTITDFKLVQMAFVFDINFKPSFQIIDKKGLLKKLFEALPKSDQVFDFYRKAKIHVENQLI